MNLGIKTISKKGMVRIPDEMIKKLNLNIGKDALLFICEDNEIKIQVIRG